MAKNYRKNFDPEAQKVKLDGVLKSLEEGIKNLWSSDQYKDYLKSISKFHRYSVNNSFLIRLQMPTFTRVASYTTWQSLGRQVLKGAKGIQILQPSPYKVDVEVERIGADGSKHTEIESKQRMSFKLASVFDISQTEGRDIPTIVERLSGNGQQYDILFDAISKTTPYDVVFKDTGRAGGYFMPAEKDIHGEFKNNAYIAINEKYDRHHQLKTLIHEIAHSEIHADIEGELIKGFTNELREVQAESVAFVVCNHFGIDSSQYSFGYIGGWASGKELNELKSSLNDIREKSSDLITRIENELELILEKDRMIKVDILESNSNLFPVGSSLNFDDFYNNYNAQRRIADMLNNGSLMGHTVSEGDANEIRFENAYDCHFKAWDVPLDELVKMIEDPSILGIPQEKFTVLDDVKKIKFTNLAHDEFAFVDRLCKANNSMLFVDDVYKNTDRLNELASLKVKVSTPMGHSLEATLSASADPFSEVLNKFDDVHNVNLLDLNHTLKDTHSDFSYFEISGSNLTILKDGIYSNNAFTYHALEEKTVSMFENASGKVNVHYRNENGVYSPMNMVSLDLSKDLNNQLTDKLPNFYDLKTDFYLKQIKGCFGQSIDHVLNKNHPITVDALGKATLEALNQNKGSFSIDDVKTLLKNKTSFYGKMLSHAQSHEVNLLSSQRDANSQAFDIVDHVDILKSSSLETDLSH